MIDTLKFSIAQRARAMGLRFDDSEIIDVIDSDYRIVFLRSIKNTRQIELPNGDIVDEEFNDPIIWNEYPLASQMRCEADQVRQIMRYHIPLPKLNILYPELIRVVPVT